MLPLVTIPCTIRAGLTPYREVFCREEGCDHISRYVTELLLNPKKTLQGIYDFQLWGKETPPSRRAMQAAVFAAGWASEGRMPRQRAVIAGEHRGQGREVLSLDWTYAPHDRGPKIWGVKRAWEHVEHRMAQDQTVVTAVIANRALMDGIEVVVQQLARHDEAGAYVPETVRQSYEPM
jgi:hypothetical protein